MWTFGVLEPGCYGAIQIDTGKQILFVPRLPQNYVIFMGPLLTLEDYKNKYQIDEVHYTDEVIRAKNKTNKWEQLMIITNINKMRFE